MARKKFEFPRITPEEAGIPSGAILDLIDKSRELNIEFHSLMILRHGKVAAEMWWKPYAPDIPQHLFSFSKSLTATAIGLAESEGLLSLDDHVEKFFPRLIKPGADPDVYSLTIRHLLAMTSGASADETNTIRQLNWAEYFLNSKFGTKPGEVFHYNSINSYMLSVIIHRATGMSVMEYLTPRIFEPLGIENVKWMSCPMGFDAGGWGVYLTTDQMARFTQLYANGGLWRGRRLLPKEWVKQATSYQTDMKGFGKYDHPIEKQFGYGYQFWAAKNGMFRADGMMGQYGFVWPEKDLVVITTAGQPIQREVLYLIYDTIFAAVDTIPEGSLPGDDYDLLNRYKTRLRLYDSQVSPRPRTELSVTGKTYKFGLNLGSVFPLSVRYMENLPFEGFSYIRLTFKPDYCVLEWEESVYKNRVVLPLNGTLKEGTVSHSGKNYRVIGNGKWINYNTFCASVRFIETPNMTKTFFRFEKDKVHISFEEQPSFALAVKSLFNLVISSESITSPLSRVIGKILEQNIQGTVTETPPEKF